MVLAKQKALVEEAKHTTLRLIRSDALVCLDMKLRQRRDDNRDTSVVLMVGVLMLGEKRRQDAGATMRREWDFSRGDYTVLVTADNTFSFTARVNCG